MSKRNVLLFLSGGSWRALAGGAGQGKAVSLARALRGLPHLLPSLDSQATSCLWPAPPPHSGEPGPRGAGVPMALGCPEHCGNRPR